MEGLWFAGAILVYGVISTIRKTRKEYKENPKPPSFNDALTEFMVILGVAFLLVALSIISFRPIPYVIVAAVLALTGYAVTWYLHRQTLIKRAESSTTS